MERKGICGNKGPCSLANGEKVQIITDDDAPFVCCECGEDLQEYKEEAGKKNDDGDGGGRGIDWKKVGLIAGCVAVLGGLGYGGYALYDSHQQGEREKAELQRQAEEQAALLRQKEIEDSIHAAEAAAAQAAAAEDEALRQTFVDAAKAKADSIIAANEKLLEEKAKKIRDDAKTVINAQLTSLRTASQSLQFENIALIDTMEVAINEAWKNADKPATTGGGGSGSGSGTVSLGYGTYTGPLSGGKPHGIGGTIKFTRAYTIDLKKASGETVEVSAGDVLNNVKMDNGRLIQGQLKRTDGNTRWIIIG